jgi:ABC-type uncharacterized transport system permease subunit
VFQGLLLFALLACDTLIAYRLKWAAARIMESTALLLAASFNAGTVLAIAALGLLINEKAGIVNLGAEGMMLSGPWPGLRRCRTLGVTGWGFLAGMGAAGAVVGWCSAGWSSGSTPTSTPPVWR